MAVTLNAHARFSISDAHKLSGAVRVFGRTLKLSEDHAWRLMWVLEQVGALPERRKNYDKANDCVGLLERTERDTTCEVLSLAKSQAEAARMLGIHRTQLWRLRNKYGIDERGRLQTA